MARQFYINGPSMVYVRSATDSGIGTITELGLSDAPIRVRPNFRYRPIKVDAWGDAPPDVQFMLATVDITISLISFDPTVLDLCHMLSMGGTLVAGTVTGAGSLLGNGKPMFHPGGNLVGNNLIQLSISSPNQGKPWRFRSCYMSSTPFDFPLGTEKSAVVTNWTAIPYDVNLYNAGLGAYGILLWSNDGLGA